MEVKCERCGKELGNIPDHELFIGGYICDKCSEEKGEKE